MSKILFSEAIISKLKNNNFVKSVSEKGITYTDEFKVYFIAEYSKGKLPSQIFQDAGFDIETFGRERVNSASKRWRKAYNEMSELGLMDARKHANGRPLSRKLSQKELLAKKDAEIAYLKSEVELFKKIELQERRVKNRM